MADYFGLREICARMGWSDLAAPRRNLLSKGFPIYHRRRGSNPRLVYYTNDALIHTWELLMVKATLQKVRERELGRKGDTQRGEPSRPPVPWGRP